MKILIAGGGIGGLTAALTLHKLGHHVQVFESTTALRPLGVGINLLPHAVGVLSRLGLAERLAEMAVATSEVLFANMHGQTIYHDMRGLNGGYEFPQYSIHRGEFQLMLAEEFCARAGAASMVCNRRLTDFEANDSGATARFTDAQGNTYIETADILIAADGIHSVARKQLYPAEGAPKWNGMMMWRGTTIGDPVLDGRTMIQAGHKRAKFVVYPISESLRKDGRALINWVCDIRVKELGFGGGLEAPNREDWSKPGRIEDLLPVFGEWRFGWLDVPSIIKRAEQVFEWPMVDRDPLPRWTFGRMTLLGDAAHPMYPIGSNGATQAILDAEALGFSLTSNADPVSALIAYEAVRRPMCADIVRMNRQEGLDVILDMVHDKAPGGFKQVSDVLDPEEIAATVRRYKTLAGHKPLSI